MNFATFERAQVAAFAYREARHTGSFDAMRGVCFVLRNRVKAGWGDGTWISVMETAHLVAATHVIPDTLAEGNAIGLANGLLRMIVRDVDDIYLNQERWDDQVRRVVCGDDPKKKQYALYYSFVNRTPRPWFVENVVRETKEHPQIGTIGSLLLYR